MSLQDDLREAAAEPLDYGRPNWLLLQAADALDALTTELAAAKAERDALLRDFEVKNRLQKLLFPDPVRVDELDGHKELFGWKRKQGGSNGLITIYVEDDKFWHEKMTFDVAWLPDLRATINAATGSNNQGEAK